MKVDVDRTEAGMGIIGGPGGANERRLYVGDARRRRGRSSDLQGAPVGATSTDRTFSTRVGVSAAEDVGSTQVVDVPPRGMQAVRLLPLLSAIDSQPAMTAIAGVDRRGAPLMLDLLNVDTWHVSVEGSQKRARSDWLRCLGASLAECSRPSDIQLLGIDLTGTELTFIEALPHSLTDVAFRPDDAIDLLSWLRDEAIRRRSLNRVKPHLVLVLDDVADLLRNVGKVASSLINQLLQIGPRTGVHVVAGWDGEAPAVKAGIGWGGACAHVVGSPGDAGGTWTRDLQVSTRGQRRVVHGVCLPAADLDRLIRGAAAVQETASPVRG